MIMNLCRIEDNAYKLYRVIYRKVNNIFSKLYTYYCRLKYFPFLKVAAGARIKSGFRLVPFFKYGRIKVILKEGSFIYNDVIIQGSGTLTLGKRSWIGFTCVIGVNEGIEIGNDVMIAYGVKIIDTNHNFSRMDIPLSTQGIVTKPIIIEDDVWIASNAVILSGITIGKGSIVAAGTVVNKSVPPYSVVGGVPGKVLYSREEREGF